jgi:hypothetical protein
MAPLSPLRYCQSPVNKAFMAPISRCSIAIPQSIFIKLFLAESFNYVIINLRKIKKEELLSKKHYF